MTLVAANFFIAYVLLLADDVYSRAEDDEDD